jgi:hypothetical protein
LTNRLTKKDRYGHFYTTKANCRNVYSEDGENLEGVFFENQTLAIDGTAIEKLGKLEDLEEQLGCPLEVVFKALLNGIYESYIDYGDNNAVKIRHRKVRGIEIYGLSVINTICGYPECDETFEYKDYKKTWFLKNDKSE